MATVYEIITDKIVSAIESSGVLPWKKPWKTYQGEDAFAKNLVSRKPYRGVNAFLLGMMPYSSPYWVTYKQALGLGGQVGKGEKGMPIVFWNKDDVEDESTGKTKSRTYLRYYTVFNVEQCDNVTAPAVVEIEWADDRRLENCERIVSGYSGGPKVSEGHHEACYFLASDAVMMPKRQAFVSVEEFYSTLYHELAHSTGHSSRLGRKEIADRPMSFGSKGYGKEELVAEMAASFLCAEAGISPVTIDNSVSYIDGWIRTIKGNPKLLIEAASHAQRASDWILNRHQGTTK